MFLQHYYYFALCGMFMLFCPTTVHCVSGPFSRHVNTSTVSRFSSDVLTMLTPFSQITGDVNKHVNHVNQVWFALAATEDFLSLI